MSDGIAQVKEAFFDVEKVQRAVDKAVAKALSKFGAFVRQRARSSLRKRKKVSDPGTPPTNRTGPLKDLLFFSYDREKETVVIGPALFGAARHKDGPRLLEEGGTVPGHGRKILVTRDPSRGASGRFESRGKVTVSVHGTLTYRPRPFMKPAFDAELPKFLGSLKDSVTG